MEKQKMRIVVIALIIISVAIYALQILIFHDSRTTAFYILQDFAFMPVTIAIATLVVGELMGEQEKKSRIMKTRMLTSTFFTEVGRHLLFLLADAAEPKDDIKEILVVHSGTDAEVIQQQKQVNHFDIQVTLTEEVYTESIEMLKGAQTALMILSSNPLLFEHEDFTDLLWGLFHLIDEHNLRGDYEKLTKNDIVHLQADYAEVLRLLLLNYISNAKYIKDTYPNLYRRAKEKIKKAVDGADVND